MVFCYIVTFIFNYIIVAEILNAGEIHRKLKKGISTVYNNPSRHLSMKDFVLLLQDEKFQFPLTVRSNINSKMNLLDKFATEVITGQIGQVRDVCKYTNL